MTARAIAACFVVALVMLSVDGLFAGVPPARTSLQQVSEGLTCQCGCGLTVANCNHPNCEFSVPVRRQIEAMIARGMDRTQIIAAFRLKYGEKILSAPTTEGFNLLAWVMPFVAVFAGCLIIIGAVSRWRADGKIKPPEPNPPPPIDAALRERLEQELREQS